MANEIVETPNKHDVHSARRLGDVVDTTREAPVLYCGGYQGGLATVVGGLQGDGLISETRYLWPRITYLRLEDSHSK